MPGPAGRFEWERLIRRASLEPTEKYVALLLATYADADGSRVHPGVERLVNVSGKSRATVCRVLSVLRDKGFVECTFSASRGGKKGMADSYRLIYPADESVITLDPDEGAGLTHETWSDPSYPQPGLTHETWSGGDQVSSGGDQVSFGAQPGLTHETPPEHAPTITPTTIEVLEVNSPVEGNGLPAENSDFTLPNGYYKPTRLELEAWNAARTKETK